MDYPKVPKRIILEGDRATAMSHIGEADSLLWLCRNQAELGGIQQYRMNRILDDGSLVSAWVFPGGHSLVRIVSPLPVGVEEKEEVQFQHLVRYAIKIEIEGKTIFIPFDCTEDKIIFRPNLDLKREGEIKDLTNPGEPYIVETAVAAKLIWNEEVEYMIVQSALDGGSSIYQNAVQKVFGGEGIIYNENYVFMFSRNHQLDYEKIDEEWTPLGTSQLEVFANLEGVAYFLHADSAIEPELVFNSIGVIKDMDGVTDVSPKEYPFDLWGQYCAGGGDYPPGEDPVPGCNNPFFKNECIISEGSTLPSSPKLTGIRFPIYTNWISNMHEDMYQIYIPPLSCMLGSPLSISFNEGLKINIYERERFSLEPEGSVVEKTSYSNLVIEESEYGRLIDEYWAATEEYWLGKPGQFVETEVFIPFGSDVVHYTNAVPGEATLNAVWKKHNTQVAPLARALRITEPEVVHHSHSTTCQGIANANFTLKLAYEIKQSIFIGSNEYPVNHEHNADAYFDIYTGGDVLFDSKCSHSGFRRFDYSGDILISSFLQHLVYSTYKETWAGDGHTRILELSTDFDQSKIDENIALVLYAGEHETVNKEAVFCYDCRQDEGGIKLAAFETVEGWKFYTENDENTITDITSIFLDLLTNIFNYDKIISIHPVVGLQS